MATMNPSAFDDSSTEKAPLTGMHVYDSAHAYEEETSSEYAKQTASKMWAQAKSRFRHKTYTYTWLDWLTVMLPALAWLRKYKIRSSLPMDLIAGASIAFMVVPQGMSYALLAGVPPVWGLYGAFVPVLVYAGFGSSRHLAVGPVAVTSLLISSSVHEMIPAADKIEDASEIPPALEGVQAEYNKVVIQITFIVGVLWFAIGVLQLGFLAKFLSHAVIAGFTAGAAITIGISQLKYFGNLDIARTPTALTNLIEVCKALPQTQWREFVMGFSFLMLLLVMKYLGKKYERLKALRALGPITVVILSISITAGANLDGRELIKSVSSVPKGLPGPTIGQWAPLVYGGRQFGTAFIVFLVDFMESISIAKAVARKNNYEISVNREIVAMGLANLVGGMFNCYTTTGSFSRTAVSSDVGARTQLQGVVSGLIVMCVLLFITPVFERLTFNATAAIIISSVIGIFDLSEARYLFRVHFFDFLVWLAAFAGTIFGGVEIGLGIAVGLALILVIYRSAFPHTAELGQVPDTSVYRNIKQYPNATTHRHICVVRADAPLYFANSDHVAQRVRKYAYRAHGDDKLGPTRFVVLDMAPVSYIDATGMRMLKALTASLRHDGMRLVLANPARQIQTLMKKAGLLAEIGQEWVFVRTSDAVAMCEREVSSDESASLAVSARLSNGAGGPMRLPAAAAAGENHDI